MQIAYRVPDLEAACHDWAQRVGAGPFLVRRHLPVTATHNGEPAVYDHSAAFGQWGPVMLEIIQLHECEPASMREVLEHEQPGQVNHFACFVDDLEAASAALEEQGMPLTMALTSSSGMVVHFHDARHVVGGILELYVGHRAPARLLRQGRRPRRRLGRLGRRPLHRPVLTTRGHRCPGHRGDVRVADGPHSDEASGRISGW